MTITVNNVWYVNAGNGTSTGYYAVAKWAATTAYTVGQIVRQNATPAVASERCFICVVAGTSLGSEPSWNTNKGAKTAESGGPSWYECTALPALNADLTSTPLSSQNRSGFQSVGNLITNNTQDHYFWCTTAQTTGSGEPTWNTTLGGTTNDGAAVWTCIGPVSSFTTKWASPAARLVTPFATSYSVAGDSIYVSSIHAESQSTTPGWSFQQGGASVITKIVCVSNTGNIPPQSTDITTGATCTSTGGGFAMQSVTAYMQGISLIAGGSAITLGQSSGDYLYLQNAALNLTDSNVGFQLSIGQGARTKIIFQNVTVEFTGSATSGINVTAANVIWKDSTSMFSHTGTSWPTNLFYPATGTIFGATYFENCDLSSFGGTNHFNGTNFGASKWVINKCKLSTANMITTISATDDGLCGGSLDIIDCDSGSNTYRHERYTYEGQHTVSTTAVYTGGATNGTTAYSWQVLPTSVATWIQPFECLPMAIWNSTTGSNRTVTVQGVYNGAALPNNDQIWIEVAYFGTASSTLGTRITETKANYLASGAALTANTSAVWNSAATARANTTAYVVGNLISVSTAATGQLYICTVSGTSAGSVPGGYATNADGSTVTDGTAHFLAMVRFQMSVTMSSPQPQSAGYFNVYLKAALASAQFFVDPSPVLS